MFAKIRAKFLSRKLSKKINKELINSIPKYGGLSIAIIEQAAKMIANADKPDRLNYLYVTEKVGKLLKNNNLLFGENTSDFPNFIGFLNAKDNPLIYGAAVSDSVNTCGGVGPDITMVFDSGRRTFVRIDWGDSGK